MAYRVLARAYRSRTFDEVVGQEAIATTLKNAISTQRVHHAYLFTGTRGVGKTSMARILAKALNCLQAEEATISPCLECESCRLISEGEDVDVIEIDGASNRGIDDIRELRNNTTLRPSRSRFKIYIIDEVHALTKDAFNALLKTLEEPPPHVKFVFATTEPEKVLDTIKSRCQRFDFRAIEADRIAAHLTVVLEGERIQADAEAVRRISRLAGGSMRDALSLLDKVLSYESEHVTAAIVDEIIPPPHDELAAAVFDAVAQRDAAAALAALDRALQSGRTVDRFCDQLIEHLRTLMLICVCGEDTELVDVAQTMRTNLAAQAGHFDAPSYVYMINLLEGLRRSVRTSGAGRALADAAMIRLAMTQQFSSLDDVLAQVAAGSGGGSATAPRTLKKNVAPTRDVARRNSGPEAAMPLTPVGVGVSSSPSAGAALQTAPRPTAERVAPMPAARAASAEPDSGDRAASGLLSSQDRQRVANDPLVQKVREAVDGTLIDIRPAVARPQAPTTPETDTSEPEASLLDELDSE